MVAKYKITIAGLTVGGATLQPNFMVVINSITIDGIALIAYMGVRTCASESDPILPENVDKFPTFQISMGYDPIPDNAKTIDEVLASDFEPLLDTAFGAGNWVKL